MQPRVDIVALPEHATAREILRAAVSTKYSRIPIYRDDIDDVVGIVFSKDLLDLVLQPDSGELSRSAVTAAKPATTAAPASAAAGTAAVAVDGTRRSYNYTRSHRENAVANSNTNQNRAGGIGKAKESAAGSSSRSASAGSPSLGKLYSLDIDSISVRSRSSFNKYKAVYP